MSRKVTFLSFACQRCAPVRLAPVRSAWLRSEPRRSAPERSLPERSTLERSTSIKFAFTRFFLARKNSFLLPCNSLTSSVSIVCKIDPIRLVSGRLTSVRLIVGRARFGRLSSGISTSGISKSNKSITVVCVHCTPSSAHWKSSCSMNSICG